MVLVCVYFQLGNIPVEMSKTRDVHCSNDSRFGEARFQIGEAIGGL